LLFAFYVFYLTPTLISQKKKERERIQNEFSCLSGCNC
jgi:hypothetical protein